MRHLSRARPSNVVWISNPKRRWWRRLESESEVQQIVFTPTSCGDFFNGEVWKIQCDSLSSNSFIFQLAFDFETLRQMFSEDTFLLEGIILGVSWHRVKIWHHLLLEVGVRRFQSSAVTSPSSPWSLLLVASLDPAGCVAQGLSSWAHWYPTGFMWWLPPKLQRGKKTVAEIEAAGRLFCQFSPLVSVEKSGGVNSQLVNRKSGAQLDNYYSWELKIQLPRTLKQ